MSNLFKEEENKNEMAMKNNEIKNKEKSSSIPEDKQQPLQGNNKKNNINSNEDMEKKSIVKLKYNEHEFKNYLKKSIEDKVPGSKNWYFSSKVIAVDKRSFKDSKPEIFWEDKHFYYISSKSLNSSGSFTSFNPSHSLVAFDKNSLDVGIVNGFFILQLKNKIENVEHFENQYHVDFQSFYSGSNIMIVRAKEKSNLIRISKELEKNPSVKSLNIEVISDFPELK